MDTLYARTDAKADALAAEFPPFPGEDETKPPSNPDPAIVVATVLLQKALSKAGLLATKVGSDGVVAVLHLKDAAWTPVMASVWSSLMRNDEAYEDGFRDRSWRHEAWFLWAPVDLEKPSRIAGAAETFASALARGSHCAALTADFSWLPADIIHSADHTLTTPMLTAKDLTTVAEDICGEKSSVVFTDDDAATLTPRLLRLARRPGQTADNYLGKLQTLLDSQRAAAAPTPKQAGSPRTQPTLDRLHGMSEAVAWGFQVRADLQAFREGSIGWADVDRGCLLSGPPGCGKSLFPRALATTCQVSLVTGSYSEWMGTGSGHQGDLLKAMRGTFARARTQTPCILFIDEVDSFPNRATISHRYKEWETQVVNALLAEVDGVDNRDGVILVAACNHPEMLDPALIRSGRLDRHIRVRLPEPSELAAILREHLGDDLAGDNLAGAAIFAAGSTGADCERLVRGARRRAREAGRPIALDDLLAEIGGSNISTPSEIWRIAVHEAGHALIACELKPGSLQVVNLRNGSGYAGLTYATGLVATPTALDIQQHLTFIVGGRAAEEALLGEISASSGGDANSDLAIATTLALAAMASMGLDKSFGLVWVGEPTVITTPQMLTNNPGLVPHVQAALDTAYQDALRRISKRRAAIEALATALIDRRAIDGTEAAAILDQHPAAFSAPAVQ